MDPSLVNIVNSVNVNMLLVSKHVAGWISKNSDANIPPQTSSQKLLSQQLTINLKKNMIFRRLKN